MVAFAGGIVGMATTAAYPPHTEAPAFTRAQWKELERQAMIYKYMVASVPVPPQLLSSDFSAPTTPMGLGPLGYASIFNLKYGDNKDPEPGRCKRTDGKKWRCSRDVAPQQKYCERHMHRGRPRSRKPVEPQHQQQVSSSPKSNKKTRLVSAAPPPPGSPGLLGSTNELGNNSPSPLLLKTVSKVEEDVSLSLYTQHSQNREMEWMMESKMMTMETSEQQWHQMMSQGSVYNTSPTDPSIFQHNNYGVEEQQLGLLSLPQIGDSSTDDYNLFMNSYNPPRDFIDAWSTDNNPNSETIKNDATCGVNNMNLSPCSLNLSMAMGVNDCEMGQIQMLEEGNEPSQKCNGLSWLSPVSWNASAPGGPLAEVLRPSNVIVNSNPGSPCAEKNCDTISPQETSPSGVLHRTMLSLSDNSVCNSPTVAAAAPEFVGFQWLN
ncbi:growth-regulating factor 7 isoform X2 [Daucus carota subsp. sativus]|uniref:growth-regulating factor 7 isoform X2 n=1 Tax=Daucus carota subsp. sativus TaxID=79200 RepID=UPI0007EF72FB|nr:PREDICTED: growth-regulating factor 7-like isoform X2 [Daucus carota subsp. sativus]